MVACEKAGLPSPVFAETFGEFLVVFHKDRYTEEYLRGLDLNERQIKAVMYVKEKGRITNTTYQSLTKVSKAMATIDLRDLVEKQILERVGTTGKGVGRAIASKIY